MLTFRSDSVSSPVHTTKTQGKLTTMFKITLARPPAAAEFEVGSIAEAVGILQQEESALVNLFRIADGLSGGGGASEEQGEEVSAPGTAAAPEAPKTRKPRAPKADAVAPAPIPVPSAAPPSPPAPNLTLPADGGIPAFLDRSGGAPAGAPPPPPLLPAAPALVPTPPVSGPVTAKVVAELQRRAAASADGGKGLVTWLAAPGNGYVVAQASFAEAIEVLHQLGDAKTVALLAPLQLT